MELIAALAVFAVLVSDSFTIFHLTGDFLFTTEPYFQKDTAGTAVGFKVFLRPASDVDNRSI